MENHKRSGAGGLKWKRGGGTLLHKSSLSQTYPMEWSLQSRVWALTGLGKHMADAGRTLGGRRGDAGWEGAV